MYHHETIGILYLAHGSITMRGCITHIHDPDLTLTFDLKVKFLGFWCVFYPYLTLVYHIWHMGVWTWENVFGTFMILIRHWPLTSRANLKGLWHGFVYRAQLFSSPELKAQVSFSNQNLFVVVIVVGVVVNFSHFHLLLQNHWANFNQTWHKASLDERDSILFKWRALAFSKGR